MSVSSPTMADWCLLSGFALVVTGLGAWSWPAALVVAGALLLLAGTYAYTRPD